METVFPLPFLTDDDGHLVVADLDNKCCFRDDLCSAGSDQQPLMFELFGYRGSSRSDGSQEAAIT